MDRFELLKESQSDKKPATNKRSQRFEPSPVSFSGDIMTAQGPTSQNLTICCPDGFRLIIPLRMLKYVIRKKDDTISELVVRLPSKVMRRVADAINSAV